MADDLWQQGLLENHPKYGEYLEEIRQRVYALVVLFAIFFFFGFFGAGQVISFILDKFQISNVTIVTTSPFQFLDLSMNVGIATALVLIIPFCLYQIYEFLADGLRPLEKRVFVRLLPISLFLFVIGFIYGFLIMYYAFEGIAYINQSLGLKNIWDIDKFISQMVLTSALLGIIFQFPIVLSFLIRLGVFDIKFLKQKRRIAYAVIFIGVSLLPPTDGVSLVVMSVPLIVIYEITIFFNRFKTHTT